ncbi:MAG: hypothetical protein JXR94_16560, partial [Candidatus Hydrogenedentes bacterium]|nr:hypothetical protein [Candidatus Hydrogenedentota bacterium]
MDPVSEADRRDIVATLDGDEQGYARIVKRYQAQIASQMWRFTRDPNVLDELVQEAFVEVYVSLSG